ncbi:hypothetical protein ACFL5Z_02325 [Planctomycetota bacterium]
MAKRKKRKARKRQYKAEMIRDFLDHLRWELSICHFENTHTKGPMNPELVDQLKKYMQKYNTVGLMEAVVVNREGVPENIADQAIARFHKAKAESVEQSIRALDLLEPVFEEALNCIAHPKSFMAREVRIDELLDDPQSN